MELLQPIDVQEVTLLSSVAFLVINSCTKHLSNRTSADIKTLVSNTEHKHYHLVMSLHGYKDRLQHPKNHTNFYGKNATCCHLSPVTSMNLFKRCVFCTLLWKWRAFKTHYYGSLLTQTHRSHNQFSTPGKRHLFTHQSHVCFFSMIYWQPQTHSLSDSKVKPLPPWAELYSIGS